MAELTGEAVQPSASRINAPISDATGKAILEAIKQGGGGGGASPVIVTADLQNNTWSGATWAELQAAYQRNAAGLQFEYPITGETMIYWATMATKTHQDHLALRIVAPSGATITIVETGEIEIEEPKLT